MGYDIIDKKYVINEKEAEAIKLIFTMYADGYGYNMIIDKLNGLGYKTKAGKPFGKNSLYSILSNEKYIGTYTFNKIAKGNSHGKRNAHKMKLESEIIRIENGMPAIISKELWNRVQSIRKVNPKGRSHNKYFYLLSGLIYCGECGSKMHGNPRNPGNGRPIYVSYRCNHKDNNHSCDCKEVRREYIESFVIEELFNHFSSSDVVSTITTQLNNSLQKKAVENSGEYNQYSTTLQLLEDSRRNLLQAIKSGGYSKSLTKELNDVESQMERCRAKMEEVDQKMSDFPQFTEEQILNQIPNFKEFSKQADREEIRIRIQQCIEKVTVYNEKIEVDFSIPFFLTRNEKVLYTFHSSIFRSALSQRANQVYFSPTFQYLTEKLHSA